MKFTDRPLHYVCTRNFTLLERFTKPCHNCKSRRIEHVEFVRQQLGEHWRELLEAGSSVGELKTDITGLEARRGEGTH